MADVRAMAPVAEMLITGAHPAEPHEAVSVANNALKVPNAPPAARFEAALMAIATKDLLQTGQVARFEAALMAIATKDPPQTGQDARFEAALMAIATKDPPQTGQDEWNRAELVGMQNEIHQARPEGQSGENAMRLMRLLKARSGYRNCSPRQGWDHAGPVNY